MPEPKQELQGLQCTSYTKKKKKKKKAYKIIIHYIYLYIFIQQTFKNLPQFEVQIPGSGLWPKPDPHPFFKFLD